MATTPATTGKAAGWCHCGEKHSDQRPCPGDLRQEEGRTSLICNYCGSTYRAEVLECEMIICNSCNGKRL